MKANSGQGACFIIGIFRVLFSCAVLLAPAALGAGNSPSISTQPQSQTNYPGVDASFSVVASGAGSLFYQWTFNGTNLTNNSRVSGATGATLTISNVAYGDMGKYQVLVSNSHGSVNSSNAVLALQWVAAWGTNSQGQVDVPAGASNAVAVAAGHGSVVLRSDGTVVAWGAPEYTPTNVPMTLSNVVSVTTGEAGQMLLLGNGTVVTSGTLAPPPSNLSNVVAVAGALNYVPSWVHAIALKNDGTVFEWNSSGQEVIGGTASTLSNIVAVAAGSFCFLGLKSDGTVVGWGNGSFGVLDIPTNLNQVVDIGSGYYSSLALKASGDLVGWGSDSYWIVSKAANVHNVAAFCYTRWNILALLNDGTLSTWGDDQFGQSTVPTGVTNVMAVTGDENHSLAIQGWRKAPLIYQQPVGLTTLAGKTALLRVSAIGNVPLRYQWDRDGSPLAGQTNRWLALTGIQGSQGGNYRVVITNNFGTATSEVATVSVLTPATILTSPTNQSVLLDSNVTFSASVTGDAPVTFQWFWNGTALTNDGRVSGANSANLTLSNLLASDAGGYQLRATNNYGSATSAVATLTVLIPAKIISQPTNYYGVPGLNASFSLVAGGTAPLSYRWYSNTVPLVNGGRFSGADAATLNITGLVTNDSAAYQVLVTNLYGAITSAPAVLSVFTLPAITVQPTNQIAIAGSTTTFVSLGSGSGPLTYQWLFNDNPLTDDARHSGSTMPTLVISNVSVADQGRYALRITNVVGSVTSSNAELILAAPPFTHTQPTWPMTSSTTLLNGMVVPNGLPTVAWFEWGTGTNYGQMTAPQNLDSGYTVIRVASWVSNLPPTIPLRCRLVSSNALGITYGGPVVFTSGQRVTEWGNLGSGLSPVPPGLSNVVAISSEYSQSMALTSLGKVVSWGFDGYGQTTTPASVTGAVAVACGVGFDLALRQDGQVIAWGRGDSGQTNVPATLTNAVAISAGFYHSVALRQDGTVCAWGSNSYGYSLTNVPVGLSNVVAVAAGLYSCYALIADGSVIGWGDVGNPSAGLSNVVAISGARYQGLAIRSDGSLTVMAGTTNLPEYLGPTLQANSGYYHSLALTDSGQVAAWGTGSYGVTNVPAGLSNSAAVSAGAYHSVALGNLPPTALAQHLSGIAGQDQTLTLSGMDANSDALQARITSLPASGTLYQWTASGRGDPILSTGTWVNDPGNRVILSQPVVTNVFISFTVSDGLAESGPNMVQVDITKGRLFTLRPQAAGLTTTRFQGWVMAAVPSQAWFEWGAFGGYGQASPVVSVAGDGTLTHIAVLETNLGERANYQCRLVVSNEFGLSYGAMKPFTTGRRVLAWGSNSNGQTNVPASLTNAVFITCGSYSGLAIKADGTPVGWGWDSYGKATPPVGLTNVVDLASGYFHSVALRSDGTALAWGNDDNGQIDIPTDWTNIVAVSAAYIQSLLLTADGQIHLYGGGGVGQNVVPANATNIVGIAGGQFANVALKVDGTVVGWGENNNGQASPPAGLMDVVEVAAGSYHSLALKANGTVVGWGKAGPATVPAGLSNVVTIAASGDLSLALTSDGVIVSWGSMTTDKGPVISGLTNVVNIAAGGVTGLALGNQPPQVANQQCYGLAAQDLPIKLAATDPNGDPLQYSLLTLPTAGSLYQWQAGGRGPLITSNNTPVSDSAGRVIYAGPNPVGDSFMFAVNDGLIDSSNATVSIKLSAAWAFTRPARPAGTGAATLFGVTITPVPGKAWFEWGAGNFAQATPPIALAGGSSLILATGLVNSLPARTNYQSRLVVSNAMAVTYGSPVLFTTGRRVVAWGSNSTGQTNVPINLSNAVMVAGGRYHSLALRADGTIAAWGLNIQTNVPVGLSNVVAVDAGGNFSLALNSDGTVAAWGSANNGPTNVPSGLGNVIEISAGFAHSLALKADGTITAWGGGNTIDQSPVSILTNVPAGLSNVVAVSAGGTLNLALKADGTVAAWGYNVYGQTNVPTGLSNVVAIAAGGYYGVALKSDGTVICWGFNRHGQTNVPAAANGSWAITSGDYQILSLRPDGTLVAWGDNTYKQSTVPETLAGIAGIAAGGSHNLVLGNLPPQTFSQTNLGVAGQNLPLTLSGSDPNNDALSYRVTTLPANGTLYQWDPDGLGTAITSTNTVIMDSLARLRYVSTANQAGWPYASFTFVANDGEVDSPASVSVLNIMAAPVILGNSLNLTANGAFSFTFNGDTNAAYRVWGSTNLTTWSVLGSPAQTSPGTFNFTDTTAGASQRQFYRVTSP